AAQFPRVAIPRVRETIPAPASDIRNADRAAPTTATARLPEIRRSSPGSPPTNRRSCAALPLARVRTRMEYGLREYPAAVRGCDSARPPPESRNGAGRRAY